MISLLIPFVYSKFSCVGSKILPAEMGRGYLVEFRGQHDDVWEFLEAVERSLWRGEQADQHDVALAHTVVFQDTQSSDGCSTTLCTVYHNSSMVKGFWSSEVSGTS